jgi:hypothetical protein
MKDTKITLEFTEKEMAWIEKFLIPKYYGRKPRNKKELKSDLGMFVSTMFNKGSQAVEYDEEYIEMR